MSRKPSLRTGRVGCLSHHQLDIQTLKQASKTLSSAAEELSLGRTRSAAAQVALAQRFLDDLKIDEASDQEITDLAEGRTVEE